MCPPFLNPRRRGSDRHMPPAANPNPDRARRAASGAPAAEAKEEFVPEPLLPVRAPAAAPIVASAAPAAGAMRVAYSECEYTSRCESLYVDEYKQIRTNTRVSSPKSKYIRFVAVGGYR